MTDVDIIIKKLLPKNKLSAPQFLKIMEQLLLKLYPTLDDAFDKIPFDSVIASNKDYAETLMGLLENENIVKMLTVLHKPLAIYFKAYASHKGYIAFEPFLAFCKDFSVFPNYFTKQKVLNMFNTMVKVQENMDSVSHAS